LTTATCETASTALQLLHCHQDRIIQPRRCSMTHERKAHAADASVRWHTTDNLRPNHTHTRPTPQPHHTNTTPTPHFLKKVVVWVHFWCGCGVGVVWVWCWCGHTTPTPHFLKKVVVLVWCGCGVGCGVVVVLVWCGVGVVWVWCGCGVGVVWAKVVSCVPPYFWPSKKI